jgi:hypothetical protein
VLGHVLCKRAKFFRPHAPRPGVMPARFGHWGLLKPFQAHPWCCQDWRAGRLLSAASVPATAPSRRAAKSPHGPRSAEPPRVGSGGCYSVMSVRLSPSVSCKLWPHQTLFVTNHHLQAKSLQQ